MQHVCSPRSRVAHSGGNLRIMALWKYPGPFQVGVFPFHEMRAFWSSRFTSRTRTFQTPITGMVVFPNLCLWQSYRRSPGFRLLKVTDMFPYYALGWDSSSTFSRLLGRHWGILDYGEVETQPESHLWYTWTPVLQPILTGSRGQYDNDHERTSQKLGLP